MIGPALKNNLIPGKFVSKKGSNCINAVMTKVFICDESRIHHHYACIASNNFGYCYDRAAHPIAAVFYKVLVNLNWLQGDVTDPKISKSYPTQWQGPRGAMK
jgi:hypothetical protein